MADFFLEFPPASSGGGGGGVSSLNALSGALTLIAGSGISITPSGSNITIDAVGSSPGGIAGSLQINDGSGGFYGDNNLTYDGSSFLASLSGQFFVGDGLGASLFQVKASTGSAVFYHPIDDTDDVSSIDTNLRQLFNNSGQLSLDYQSGSLYFIGTGDKSIDWVNQKLYDDGGPGIVMDWHLNQVYASDSPGTTSLDWMLRQIYDSVGFLSLDWNSRTGYGISGNRHLQWEDSKDLFGDIDAAYFNQYLSINHSTGETAFYSGAGRGLVIDQLKYFAFGDVDGGDIGASLVFDATAVSGYTATINVNTEVQGELNVTSQIFFGSNAGLLSSPSAGLVRFSSATGQNLYFQADGSTDLEGASSNGIHIDAVVGNLKIDGVITDDSDLASVNQNQRKLVATDGTTVKFDWSQTDIYMPLRAFASDAAAGTAGLVGGDLYQTNGAGLGVFAFTGVVMVKQ